MATSKPNPDSVLKSQQQLSLVGAVAIGLASMLGAGVFFVWSSAWSLAHDGIYLAALLAAAVASLNAASVYQLASNNSRPGGIYSYSRQHLNPSTAFVAGIAFVFGKIGSIAAIALIIDHYVNSAFALPNPAGHLAAIVTIAALFALNVLGINRTALVAGILASVTLLFLLFSIGSAFQHGSPTHMSVGVHGGKGILAAASLLFFAFAGYARVATLGDEVRESRRNIPRAIVISLAVVIAVYFAIVVALFGFENPGNEATSDAPFVQMLARTAPNLNSNVVIFVVVIAALGSMLALLAGTARTAATMAADGELPKLLAKRNKFGAPYLVESMIALTAIGFVIWSEQTWIVIGFSSFSVLLYYAIGHLAVLAQPKEQRKQPRIVAILGFALCAVLVLSVPGPAVGASTAILVIALLIRSISSRLAGRAKRN